MNRLCACVRVHLLSIVVFVATLMPTFADIEWAGDWAGSEPPIRFESRDWAEETLSSVELEASAIEGGRLQSNTMWSSGVAHLVVNSVYVPNGVTLTISAGALVRFCEGTFIKVEDGGALNVIGAAGADVIFEGEGECIRLQSSAASYKDNGYLEVFGLVFGKWATVTINDAVAFRGGGNAIVPVYVSGNRDIEFSLDWAAETNGVCFANGTIKWNKTSEGTKNIEIEFGEAFAELESFTIKATALRGCVASQNTATITLSDYVTMRIDSVECESEPAIRFESREWLDEPLGEIDLATTSIEGGRLSANTVWASNITHFVVNSIYVPNGVTLTITAGAKVKFCSGTLIKVEDGGRLIIVGEDGADVVFEGEGECIRLQSSVASYSDNGWLEMHGFTYGDYPWVSLNDSVAFRSDGVAMIPVTVSGTRNQEFTIDWVAEADTAEEGLDYTLSSGRITWNKASEGTKTISIPLNAQHIVGGTTEFKVKISVARGVNISRGECTVEVRELKTLPFDWSEVESQPPIRFECREWAEAKLEEAMADGSVVVEGGRLQSNTTWNNDKTHLVFSSVYVPNGVTLTITAGALVRFCDGTFIKVEDGGRLNVVGADGADVIFEGEGECVRLQSSAATLSDNGWFQIRGFEYGAHPTVTIHDAVVSRAEGNAYIAVTISGATRNQEFTLDWEADNGTAVFARDYTGTRSGRLTWAKSSEGTKYIEIPLNKAEKAGGSREFTVRLVSVRCAHAAQATATVTIAEFGNCEIHGEVEIIEADESSAFAVNARIKQQPTFLNEVETIQYSGRWQDYDANKASMLRVSVESDNGVRVLHEAPTDATGSFELDMAEFDVGCYKLKHEIIDKDGKTLAIMTKGFSVVNESEVEVHGGTLSRNETWSAGKVHVVFDEVFVPAQYTLFIEPGAIVKFFTGTGITIEDGGGALFADQIIFTHINDDTVGGDSLNDGYDTAPPMDAYTLKGNFTFGDVELRCITQSVALSGTIANSLTLSRGSTYKVSGTVTIASGGTLTIPAGTILKMEQGASIVVNSGGTLNANGTRAAPIFITSIRDDEHGGDTNKDGDETIPQPGDWKKIAVYGTANMDYCKLLYGAAGTGTDDMILVSGDSASVVFNNGLLAHGSMYAIGVESGHFYMTNSVVTDFYCVFRHWPYDPVVNSVVYDCTRLSNNNGQKFYNCVIQGIVEAWDWSSGAGNEYHNCLFWNESGAGLQSLPSSASIEDGNIWGNPCFADPDNGDFRITATSACRDAGDSEMAPETDYYGQPRVGAVDIGISEFQLRGGSSEVDLQPNSLTVEGEAIPGHLIFAKWEVINVGSGTISEPWRDTLTLVNSSGQSVVLGDKMCSNKVGSGGVVFCSGYFTVPAIAEGEWRVKLNVNSYHDVFEGTLTENNTMIASTPITVSLAPTYAADGMVDGVVSGGLPMVRKLVFVGDDENRMVRIRLPEGVRIRYGVGFMPSTGDSTGEMLSAGNDVLFKAEDGDCAVYLVLESESTVEYTLSFESGDMQMVSVSQTVLPCSGNVTFTVTGAGFEKIDSVSLACGGERVSVESFTVIDAQTIVATVDCSKLTVGIASLCVSGESGDALLPDAFNVTAVEGEGHFWARLIVPESVRQGRKVTCYVEYGNDGNADIPCQVVQVIYSGDGGRLMANGRRYENGFKLVVHGDMACAGVIKAKQTYRNSFELLAGSINDLKLSVVSGVDVAILPWVSEAVKRLCESGECSNSLELVLDVARTLRDGDNVTLSENVPTDLYGYYNLAVSGDVSAIVRIGDFTNGIIVSAVRVGNAESTVFRAIAVSGDEFVFRGLPDGIYRVSAVSTDGSVARATVVISSATSPADISLSLTNTGCLCGKVFGAEENMTNFVSAVSAGFIAYAPVADNGEYYFYNLPIGEYSLSVVGDLAESVQIVSGVSIVANEVCSVDLYAAEMIETVSSQKADRLLLGSNRSDGYGDQFYMPWTIRRESQNLLINSYFLLCQNLLYGPEDVGCPTCAYNIAKYNYYKSERGRFEACLFAYKDSLGRITGVGLGEALLRIGELAVRSVAVYYELVTNNRRYVSILDKVEEVADSFISNDSMSDTLIDLELQTNKITLGYKRVKESIDQITTEWHALDISADSWDEILLKCAKILQGIATVKNEIKDALELVKHLSELIGEWDAGQPIGDDLKSFLLELTDMNAFLNQQSTFFDKAESLLDLLVDAIETADAATSYVTDTLSLRNSMNRFYPQVERFMSVDFCSYHLDCDDEELEEPNHDDILDLACPIVPTSIDPNEMAGPKGIAQLQYINVGDYLEYTVYFENKSDATAAAQEVRITNPLSEYLDWNSFEVIETAFNNQVDLGLNGKTGGESEVVLNDTDYKVRSKVSFDKTKGIIDCYIRIVDESTDSTWPDDVYAGFLPPNDDTKCGEGHFTYRVKLREDAPAWETVINTASIVFDYNEAIETDPSWWNTVLIPLSMNDILNADNVYFNNDEVAPWDMDLDNSCAEDDRVSYRSGVIFNGEQTAISMPVKGPGTVSFWWRCSAEYETVGDERVPLDYGYLVVDGVDVGVAISGWETEWTNRTYKVTGDGQHQISWVYCKNDEDVGDVGDDSLWVDGVVWESDWPSIAGDRDAEIVKHDDGSFEVQPSMVETNLCVKMPPGVDTTKVTVVVDAAVDNFSLGGANAKIIKNGHDITPYLDIPEPDNDGWIAMAQIDVKQSVADEVMDQTKGAAVYLEDTANPVITTSATKAGLKYTLREGRTLETMEDGDYTEGDGQPWTPTISVTGGDSAFYTIKVEK